MVTFLITSFLLLAAVSYFIYLWQRPRNMRSAERLLPPTPDFAGLFGEAQASDEQAQLEQAQRSDEQCAQILERARSGEKSALVEAHRTGDAALYDQALNALADHAGENEKRLRSLASYIVRHDERLRVNEALALKFIEAWKRGTPGRLSTAEMLHITSLASDAELYQKAIEAALQFWRNDQLKMTAQELRLLIESGYWVLDAKSRSSGAGFVLKRKIAALRRELAASGQLASK